ncbi:hypothetical protein TNCV_3898711 [Trichonephila clavipes]|nr:hypothetical protein TNCV_3898711 [Trichonephila clavipes]
MVISYYTYRYEPFDYGCSNTSTYAPPTCVNSLINAITNFKFRPFVTLFSLVVTEIQEGLVSEPDKIDNETKEVVDLARQINLDVNNDDVKNCWITTINSLQLTSSYKCMSKNKTL